MMKRQLLVAAVVGLAVVLSATPAQAFGHLFGKKKGGGCEAPCATAAVGSGASYGADACCDSGSAGHPGAPGHSGAPGYPGSAGCADAGPSTPAMSAPAMTTQTVIRYVSKPTTTKQAVTTTTYQWSSEAYTYTVNKPVTSMVQKPMTRIVCVPTQVAFNVPVTHKICVPVMCCSPCGVPSVSYRTECVTTHETRHKTVMQSQSVTEMHNVPVTTFVSEQVAATRPVCKPVTTTKMVDVTTYTSAPVTRTGTRQVCKPVTTTNMVDVTTYTTEAVTETIQVPVTAPSYGPGSADCGMSGSGSQGAYGNAGCGTCGDGYGSQHIGTGYAYPPASGSSRKGGRLGGLFHHGKSSACGCN